MDREIGSAVRPCPDCGAPLPVVALPDGAVTYGACEKGKKKKETAAAPVTATVREYGTKDNDEDAE